MSILSSHNLKAPVAQMTDSELEKPFIDSSAITLQEMEAVLFEELKRSDFQKYFEKRWLLTN